MMIQDPRNEDPKNTKIRDSSIEHGVPAQFTFL